MGAKIFVTHIEISHLQHFKGFESIMNEELRLLMCLKVSIMQFRSCLRKPLKNTHFDP